MSLDILQYEQQHLDRTVVPLKAKQQKIKNEVDSLLNDYQEGIKKVAKESLSLDEKMVDLGNLNKMMKSQEYKYKKDVVLKRINDQVNKPYFAKINFKEKTQLQGEDYYIGRFAHYDKDPKYHVVDWRAPLASIYYNNNTPTKNVTYSVNAYDKITDFTGDLEQRVNFDIDDSKILAIYDNSLRIDLLKLRISQKSGGKLTDIVETIQDTQNKIIRANPFNVCVVQGTAGSGKTTIAVHRLSYILYAYKNQIKEKDTLLISSSEVLLNYVSTTLPELDVISVDRFTLEDLFSQSLIEDGFVIYNDSILGTKDERGNILNSFEFLHFLNGFCNKLKTEIIEDLESEKFYDALNLKSYFLRSYNTPIFDTLNYMKENLESKHFILKKELKSGNFTVENEVDFLSEALYTIRQILNKYPLQKLYKKALTQFSLELKDTPVLFKDYYNVDDLSAVYILGKLLYASSYKHKLYKQVIIDEAQDLGLLNYMAIRMLCEKSGFTILGDLNQRVNGNGCILQWSDLETVFGKENIDFFEIKVSYRTTKQIITVAKNILSKFTENTYLPEAFEREGKEVEFLKLDSKEKLLEKIAEEINAKRASGDLRAVAIIECDKQNFDETKRFLDKKIANLEPIYSTFENFSDSATYLINADLVKGLEFDTVYIVDPNEKLYPFSLTNSKRLFVLATRAINTLKVYYFNPITKLFQT